jgi:cytochrome b561
VFVQIALGVYAANLPVSLARLQWLSRHKSLGLLILALVLLRMVWRVTHRPPALPASMARWERRAAIASHRALYVLLLLTPLAGWLYASAAGLSVNWFGWFLVPDLIDANRKLASLLKLLHKSCAAALVLLIALHVGAALRHAFLLRDGVMHRMLPWRPSGKP